METIRKKLSLRDKPQIIRDTFTEETILFDIETTGFSPRTTDLYLIGVAYREGEDVWIEQYLAGDASEQSAILARFLSVLNTGKTLLTYNGVGFDIPYLKEKLEACALPDPFASFRYLDLFKEVKPFRTLLALPDCKQKSVERFLGIHRDDRYSGGDLIPIYRHYRATKDAMPRELLLLHNYEDVLGMIDLIPVLAYPRFFGGGFSVDEAHIEYFSEDRTAATGELLIALHPIYPLPSRITAHAGPYFLAAEGDSARFSVSIFRQALKYFFPDPENYYYLPDEDRAIHKSVGAYVERTHRKQATKATCYTRKEGLFLPQPQEIFTPAFRREYKDKALFFEVTERTTDVGAAFLDYLRCCLDCVVKG